MRCPVCESTDLAISSREGVEIDYCPQCRGVWLDRGELDKIIDRAGPVGGGGGRSDDRPRDDRPREDRPRDSDDRYDRDRYDKRKKRRSFLEEIFDFD